MTITKKERETIMKKLGPAMLALTQLTTWVYQESGYFEETANKQYKKRESLKWKNHKRSAS